MGNLLDTILNVTVFAFIGVMIWLYFKKTPASSRSENTATEDGD